VQSVNVGTGEFSYAVAPSWGKLPRDWELGMVSAVAVDSKDRVYVYNRGTHPLVMFDRDGNFLASWGEGSTADPHGIFVGPDDGIYLVDRDAHVVQKFSPQGELLLTLGSRCRPSNEAPFSHPTNVAVSPSGEIYVTDGYGNSRVHIFSADGKLLSSFGAPGSGPGEFMVPHGIWVDGTGRVYVVDRENHRVQIFSSDGRFITQWTGFYRPTDIYVDAHDRAYIVDHIPRFSVFGLEGKLLARGRTRDVCHGIWGDSRGDLYGALVFERRVEKYVKLN